MTNLQINDIIALWSVGSRYWLLKILHVLQYAIFMNLLLYGDVVSCCIHCDVAIFKRYHWCFKLIDVDLFNVYLESSVLLRKFEDTK
jgi:hypothetical protein